MDTLHLILRVLALVCLLIASWQPEKLLFNRLLAGGLAALVASMIVL